MNTTILSLALFCIVAPPVKTEKTPQTLLYVRTTPSGAEIRLDGKPLGTSDDIFKVEPGVCRIVVELEGHDPKGKKVTIRASRITRVELVLKQRDEAGRPDSVAQVADGNMKRNVWS